MRNGYECGLDFSTIPVTFIYGYADSNRVYGIELYWGASGSKIYAVRNGLDPQLLDTTGDPIRTIKICADSNNLLSGILFRTVSGTASSPLILGHLCGSENQIAFNNADDVLTNMQVWHGAFINGVKFVYTGPSNK